MRGIGERAGLEGVEVGVPEHERGRHGVRDRELGREHVRGIGVRHAQPERNRGHADGRDLLRRRSGSRAPHGRERVEREVVVAAARVELEVVLLDAVAARPRPSTASAGLEAVGEDRAVHVGGRIGEPGEAARCSSTARMPCRPERPGIDVADGGALERGRPRVGRAHRGGEVDDAGASRGVEPRRARATATAVPMVPHVPCEWTLGRAVVAPPSREPTS